MILVRLAHATSRVGWHLTWAMVFRHRRQFSGGSPATFRRLFRRVARVGKIIKKVGFGASATVAFPSSSFVALVWDFVGFGFARNCR